MGVCQSIGGASTSGHGLTALQVTGALVTAATAPIESRRNHPSAVPDTDRPPTNDDENNPIPKLEQLDYGKYCETREVFFQVPNSEGKLEEVKVCEYAPDVFRFLRELEGLDDDMFVLEWSIPEDQMALELGEGRSMALFLNSRSMDLMCKTISSTEVDVFLSMLRNYTEYVARNPDSFLMRFSMLLRVEAGSKIGFILCFSDVFAPCHMLHEKWDLKGRVPKLEKLQLFPRTTDTLPEAVNVSLSSGLHQHSSVGADKMTASNGRLATLKDKNLTRVFWLGKLERQMVLENLIKDYEFLGSMGLMDYSLLIGVVYNDNETAYAHNSTQKMCPASSKNSCKVVEIRKKSSLLHSTTTRKFATGIDSLREEEVYYIGIIDILTKYTWKKKIANFCKSILWKDWTLSTIPPAAYLNRITNYTKIIFPDVELPNNTDN